MANGLDHVVHAVRDLDAAAHLYRRLGFTTGARNRHPWGTHNVLVQLPGFFIEMLTVAEPEKLGDDGITRLFGRISRFPVFSASRIPDTSRLDFESFQQPKLPQKPQNEQGGRSLYCSLRIAAGCGNGA